MASTAATDEVDIAQGLSTDEVAERTRAGQVNAYRAETSRSAGSIIRANVFTLFSGIVFAPPGRRRSSTRSPHSPR